MPDEIDEDRNFNGWVRYAKKKETWNAIVDNFFLGNKNETTHMTNNEKKVSSNFSHLDELFKELKAKNNKCGLPPTKA